MDDHTRQVDLLPDTVVVSLGKRPSRLKRVFGLAIGAIVLGAVVMGGALYWLNARQFATTDDAFIDAYTTQMAPRVAGQVTKLLFADNQHVSAGQTLVLIDPRDYQAKLDQAQAQQASAEALLTQAKAQVLVQQSAVDQAAANVRMAESDLLQAKQDYNRFQTINPHAVTRQQIDASTATFHTAQAKLDANRQTVGGLRRRFRRRRRRCWRPRLH